MQLYNATEWLFFHLWKNNPKDQLPCPNIRLPYTVIYRWNKPHIAFYQNENYIIRVEKQFVNTNMLITKFESVLNQICAFVHITDSGFHNNQEKINFEYISPNCNSIKRFFYEQSKGMSSIVQEFIMPKDDFNSN